MEVQDVSNRVAKIEAIKGDYEAAHDMEDELYSDVLEHIAAGGKNGQALVKEALKAQQVKFPRYTA